MAEEKKTPAKVEESKLTKIINWFKKLPGRIAKPFKNMVAELKKVTWPSKKKWISSSVAVLVFMLFMGVVIGLLDLGATALVNIMIGGITPPFGSMMFTTCGITKCTIGEFLKEHGLCQ